ncbi:HAUS augmin-like complex subunit 1 [Acipenser oxyrinchus oxyrinchus]|uniref:HAUS augmin-like complex subunit 1 n=1 Tax=Acipenser oxyrinchus oxyrinchus TaxID=40147 RepID=A0AAD8GI88_ACIOX|nr:HAUS augmin-like complex subunit 1 [Acipenser oxyrinchus oxyrinchus]
MCEKTIKVTQWLGNIFGDQPIPHYEVNTRTMEILYQLAESSEARCRDVVLLTEDLKQKAAEYGTEGSYLQELLLEGVGLSSSSLSKTASSYLNALEGSAMALNTKDTSLASYVPAMNDLTADILATEKKNQEMDHELTTLRRKLTSALVLRKSLQEDLSKTEENQVVEKARAENRLQNMDFFKAKSEDLKFRIKAAENQLSATRMEPSLSHQALLDLSEKLAKLKQETIPMKKKLESFLDLTPNPSLAQVKIEEAKRELAAIDAELTMKVDMMEIAMPDQHARHMI